MGKSLFITLVSFILIGCTAATHEIAPAPTFTIPSFVTATSTKTPLPSLTPTPSLTPLPTSTATPTPTLTITPTPLPYAECGEGYFPMGKYYESGSHVLDIAGKELPTGWSINIGSVMVTVACLVDVINDEQNPIVLLGYYDKYMKLHVYKAALEKNMGYTECDGFGCTWGVVPSEFVIERLNENRKLGNRQLEVFIFDNTPNKSNSGVTNKFMNALKTGEGFPEVPNNFTFRTQQLQVFLNQLFVPSSTPPDQ